MVSLKEQMGKSVGFRRSIGENPKSIGVGEVVGQIKQEQVYSMYRDRLRQFNLGMQYELELYGEGNEMPRYRAIVVDSQDEVVLGKREVAIFITPQGRENEAVFGSELGRRGIVEQAGFSRLVFVVLSCLRMCHCKKACGSEFSWTFSKREELLASVIE